jgi:hypothetical protein
MGVKRALTASEMTLCQHACPPYPTITNAHILGVHPTGVELRHNLMVRSFYVLRASLAGLLSPSLTLLIFTFIQLTLLFVQLGPSLFAFHFSASIYLFHHSLLQNFIRD